MVHLNEQTEKLLEERVQSGDYGSADEVVMAALLALDEAKSIGLSDEVRDAIDRAEDQIDSGQVHDWKDVRESVRNMFLGK